MREFKLRFNKEEVMFEFPPEWNAVPDLIMEDEEGMMITETDTKRKRDVTCRYDGLTCLQNNIVFFSVLPIV